MAWRRGLGSLAAQTGACGALLSLPEGARDDVAVAPALGAIYAAGAGAFYALGGAGSSVAQRALWYRPRRPRLIRSSSRGRRCGSVR